MNNKQHVTKALIWAVIASVFLSATFIINSLIANAGGHWTWTANLRTLLLIPILMLVLLFNKQLKPLLKAVRNYPLMFMKWGITGFGVLYTSVSVAALFTPGWMVAATFQINILAGILLAPVIYSDHRKRIPGRALALSVLIVVGVFVMQFEKLDQLSSWQNVMISFGLVLIGAIVWPLGNRKLMVDLEHKNIKLNSMQRVLGMSLGCIPLLVILATIGYQTVGLPTWDQFQASLYSAFFSGFIGGVCFYQATQMVNKNPVALATIEATQVFEILFTLIGEMILIQAPFPGIYGQIGIAIVMLGIFFHYRNTLKQARNSEKDSTLVPVLP